MSNDLQQRIEQHQTRELDKFYQEHPFAVSRGIDPAMWEALTNTVYVGAKPESILMAVDYCRARKLDVMLKPVHLVPMNVKNSQTGQYEWRDVPMAGIGLYRIQADRSKTYAGMDSPVFGENITRTFTDKNGKQVEHTFPEWCSVTVYKLIGDRVVGFTAREEWLENYATDSGKSDAPNAMWLKRTKGQIAKCAEAQALRKAWPEVGAEPTAEEMEGKTIEREINPLQSHTVDPKKASVDPKDLHAEVIEPETVDEEAEFDNAFVITEADKLAEMISACQTIDSLKDVGGDISDGVKSGALSIEDQDWLRSKYTEKQKQLSKGGAK